MCHIQDILSDQVGGESLFILECIPKLYYFSNLRWGKTMILLKIQKHMQALLGCSSKHECYRDNGCNPLPKSFLAALKE